MKLGIIACGAIVRELIAIANLEGWDFALTAVPAQLHNAPEAIPAAVQAKVDAWAAQFDVILVGYGDCGTAGALDQALAGYANVVRIPGPHCYDFYGGDVFTTHNEAHPGTFYLTDFLARHFDTLVWKGLGIAQHPELRPLYFGNYTHVLYLNQLPARDEDARARAAAVARRAAASTMLNGLIAVAASSAGPTCQERAASTRRSRKRSRIGRATRTRDTAEHFWFACPNAERRTPSTASSMSASAKTSAGFLPPISAISVRGRPAASVTDVTVSCIQVPTAREPVKATIATRGSSTRTRPAERPSPGTH